MNLFRLPPPPLRAWLVLGVAVVLLAAGLLPVRAAVISRPGPGLRNSRHNLALGAPSQLVGAAETDMCKFCHTPHGGAGALALWNQTLSSASYIPYRSSTLKAVVGQPTGDSKLCLSCHDGTVALGALHHRRPGAVAHAVTAPLRPGRLVLGTDLSDDHPVSFSYASALAGGAELKPAALLNDRVRLDGNGEVQCTSCHDPHNDQNGNFLAVDNHASALCLNCHAPALWNLSDHRNSARTWNGAGRNPWPNAAENTVAGNACENCHIPHNAGIHERLLRQPLVEDNCLVCHNGSAAAKNVAADFNKFSVHPVLATSSLHDAAEDSLHLQKRHAACVDCHNPHAASSAPAVRPNVGGALAGVAGVNSSGAPVARITREYELCFRCHADSVLPAPVRILRQVAEPNTRLQFKPANASYHPVVSAGRGGAVPSLIAPWNPASVMNCLDCHNSDQSPAAGGAGANGPHGSQFSPLLERQLDLTDDSSENSGTYALCYKCHSRDSLLANQSFKGHQQHVVKAKTACTTCHDPHGVANAPHLINFNLLYVKPAASGRLEYTGAGTCTLNCHSHEHSNVGY